MHRLLAVALSGFALAGCGTTDLVNDEVEAQKDRVGTVIKDPGKAADEALQNELRQRGVDGSAPPVVP